jgi:hypothetical protein
VSFGFLTNAERSRKFAPSCLELIFTNLYSKGVIDSFPVTGFGRGGVVGGALLAAFFCGVLNGDMDKRRVDVDTGDALTARTGRGTVRRGVCGGVSILLFLIARTGGGRALVSLTTVTPDALRKF